jgi:hypothetical protein
VTPLDKLPVPLRDRSPLRWTEVLPVTEFVAPFAPPPVLPAQLKYTADLRAALLDPATKDAPLRVEAVFENRIDDVEALRTRVSGRYVNASLDGIIGNVVSIRFARASLVEAFALEPGVLGLRLPREPRGRTQGRAARRVAQTRPHRRGCEGGADRLRF